MNDKIEYISDKHYNLVKMIENFDDKDKNKKMAVIRYKLQEIDNYLDNILDTFDEIDVEINSEYSSFDELEKYNKLSTQTMKHFMPYMLLYQFSRNNCVTEIK